MAEAPTTVPVSAALDWLDKNAETSGVAPSLAKQIFLAENLNETKDGRIIVPNSIAAGQTSPKDAYGLMQVRPSTHAALIKQGYLPEGHTMGDWQTQLEAGLAAISAMQKEQKTTDPTVIGAAYNGGFKSGRLASEGKHDQLPAETQKYGFRMAAARDFLGINNTATGAPSASVSPPTGLPTSNLPVRPGTSDTIGRGIEAMQQVLTDGSKLFDELVKTVTDSSTAAASAKTREADSLRQAGEARARADVTTGVVESMILKMKERTANILGVNTNNTNNVVAAEISKQDSLEAQMNPLKADIDRRMSVGLFDNPLQWLINQTVLPGKVAQYNAQVQDYNNSATKINYRQTTADAQNKVDVAGTADLVAQQYVDISKANAAQFNAKAETALAEASGARAAATLSIARLAEQQQDNKRQSIQYALTLAEHQERSQLKEKDRKQLEETDATVKTIGEAIGAPNMSSMALKNATKEVKDMWERAIVTKSAGDSFTEAFLFIKNQGNLNNLRKGARAEFAQYQQDFQDTFSKRVPELYTNWSTMFPASGGKVPTEKQVQAQALTEIENSIKHEVNTNMLNAHAYNPYLINHSSTIKQWSGDVNNPVYQFVKTQLEKGTKINDTILLKAISQQVSLGQVAPRDAAIAVADYYSTAVARNNAQRDFNFMGMPAQETYRVVLPGSKVAANLTNIASIDNLFTSMKVKSARFPPIQSFATTPEGAVTGAQMIPRQIPQRKPVSSDTVFAVPAPENN